MLYHNPIITIPWNTKKKKLMTSEKYPYTLKKLFGTQNIMMKNVSTIKNFVIQHPSWKYADHLHLGRITIRIMI